MKNKIFFVLLPISVVLFFVKTSIVQAADSLCSITLCEDYYGQNICAPQTFVLKKPGIIRTGNTNKLTYRVDLVDKDPTQIYQVITDDGKTFLGFHNDYVSPNMTPLPNDQNSPKYIEGEITDVYINLSAAFWAGQHAVKVKRQSNGNWDEICRLPYQIQDAPEANVNYTCEVSVKSNNSNPNIITPNDSATVNMKVNLQPDSSEIPESRMITLSNLDNNSYEQLIIPDSIPVVSNNSITYTTSFEKKISGHYSIDGAIGPNPADLIHCPPVEFDICLNGCIIPTLAPSPTPFLANPPQCYTQKCLNINICKADCNLCPGCSGYMSPTPSYFPTPTSKALQLIPLCESIGEGNAGSDCRKCVDPVNKDNPELGGKGGIWSAIGCLPTDLSEFINEYLFVTGIGIIGGIAFLYLLYGSFLILTSAGNPEQVAQAREIITSSIMGLLLAIFSVLILRIISVDILRLPGFESGLTPTPAP